MSGMLRTPATATPSAGARAPAGSSRALAAGGHREPLLRLAAFAALGLFGAAHWGSLVVARSTGRTLLVVFVATGGAGVLTVLGRPAVRRALMRALGGSRTLAATLIAVLALAVGLVTIALGLVAAGLPLRLLGWNNWPELSDGLNRGLAGVQSVEWPYGGPDEWIRRTTLLGPPFLLGIAATLAFFPARRAAPGLRVAGLVVLLLLYGVPVTEHDPGAPLLRGLVLLVLVAGWLWLPRLGPREAAAGAALVVSLGALSLPIAAALNGHQRWWDYGSLGWFGAGKVVSFEWTHRYGPLNWPRKGTTLLNVKSAQPHYWKAETLDTFDGLRWVRASTSDAEQQLEGVPDPRTRHRTWNYFQWNPRWDNSIRFTVRSLSSTLLVAAGTTYDVQGAGLISAAGDGTLHLTGDPLKRGDSYTIRTYAPDPSPRQMRGAPGNIPSTLLKDTSIELPGPRASALDAPSQVSQGGQEVLVPLWGDTSFGDPQAPGRVLRRSAYARMYRIATSVTAGAPSMYDAVARIQRYLDRHYSYSERTPQARYPLNAFLFRDRFGYCQQFSGTMALMLRMVGIPTRVAAGFAPGSFNRDTGEYRVRDLDAHSWVEVYFNGIGWVTFDPTPAASPAAAQAADLASTSVTGGAINGSRGGGATAARAGDGASSPVSQPHGGVSPWLLLPLLALAGAGALAVRQVRRTRRLSPSELAEAQLAELRRALARLDWEVPGATTLLGLERRLGRAAGPASAGYAAGLRAYRYDPRSPGAPHLSERRALRRELTAGGGPRVRLLGLLAIPPGGPRPV